MSNPDEIPVTNMDDDNVLNEDEELMPNPNATELIPLSDSRRGKRSTAKCNKTAKKIAAGIPLKIEFDDEGAPTGDNATKFKRNVAQKTRNMIPISYKRWALVPKEMKIDLYASIAMTWNISADCPPTIRKKILSACATRWRAHKCRLNKRYRLNPPADGEQPFDVHNIAQEEWDEFDEYYGSPEFQELSRKGKENDAKKDMHHTLRSDGYISAKKTWKKREVVHGATSVISEEVDSRSYRWCRARAKKDENGELRCTNDKVAQIVDKAVDLAKSGDFQAYRQNDILTTTIGTREHSGRLRGYPHYSGVKQVFGKGTRTSRGYTKEEVDRLLQEEVNKRGSMEALLFLPGDNFNIVYVARAMVFARSSMPEIVHGVPLGNDEFRVQLLEVFQHASELSPPCPPPNTNDRLGMLQSSFLRWPSHLVDFDLSKLGHMRQVSPSFAKNKGKHQEEEQVEEESEGVDEDFDLGAFLVDGEVKMRQPFCTLEKLRRLGPNALELHSYMMMVDPSMTHFEIKAKFENVELDSFLVNFDDIDAVFKRKMLQIQIMKVWTM
ncbi:hypothetical protein LUZ61_013389 [Rhynchospora tenuis]|uniref:Uncharacterized protein n=1 Tax=Rhynchospora tenuis TaxID=198213 RepID=A0AAD5W9A4_9POAL|nr:hypothetical protein LUZ61_013389 [Rhynchospora tenuis]